MAAPPLAHTTRLVVPSAAELGCDSMGNIAPVKRKWFSVLGLIFGMFAGGFGIFASPNLAAAGQAEKQPARKSATRTDRYGDPLPPGALARCGTIRRRGGSTLFRLPQRDAFLSISYEEANTSACVWRMATGELLRRFEIPLRRMGSALSPDGTTLAIAGFDDRRGIHRLLFWDVASGKMTDEMSGAGAVLALAFTSDGKTLATAEEGQRLRLWNWRRGTELRGLKGARANCYQVEFSPDGKVLASACVQQRVVQLWDTATGKELHALGSGPGIRSMVRFAPDGKTVATVDLDDQTVHLWDVASGKEVRQFASPLWIYSLAFSPDGQTLAAGCRPSDASLSKPTPIHLWDVPSGKEVRRLSGHLFPVTALLFSADGKRLISSGSDSTLRVWDTSTGKELLPLPEHESWVMTVAFSPDGQSVATGSLDGTIRLWQTETGKPIRRFGGGTRPQVYHLAFSPNGQALISNQPDGLLHVWDAATGREVRSYRISDRKMSHKLAPAPDGRTVAVWQRDGIVRLWDVATEKELRKLGGGGGVNNDAWLCFAPDGGKLALLGFSYPTQSGVLQVWDTATGTQLHKWDVPLPGPIAFSPDGRTVIGGTGNFSLAPGTTERTFHLWDVVTGVDRPFTTTQHARIQSIAVSPNGRTLAWGDAEGTITLWGLAAGQVRRRLKGHHSKVQALDFSPDGKTLASGSADTTALLWDVTGLPFDRPALPLDRKKLPSLWTDLASTDAGQAFDAVGLLCASPELAVPLLRNQLRPAPDPAERRLVARLIADLDSEDFAVRDQSMKQLRQLGERAEPGLREALRKNPALEARKRIEELLERVRTSTVSGERLRELRAIEVLEQVGTAEARQVLKSLADGPAHARLTHESSEALKRLAKRHPPKP